MNNRFIKQFIGILIFFLASLPFYPKTAIAACGDNTCDYRAGEDIFNCKADCLKIGNATKAFTAALSDATSWLLGFAASLCVLMMIIGGLYYIFSAGDQEQATTGKKILKYSLLGLVIAGISYALIRVIGTVLS